MGFWMDDGEMSRASKGRMTELFANNRRVFDALGRKVTPYAWKNEIAPGVTAIGTPVIASGTPRNGRAPAARRCYVQSDVCNNVAVFAPHPDWQGFFDQDGGKAAATRGTVYEMLVGGAAAGAGLSLPVPGAGADREAGDGYRVVPTNSL